MITNDDARRIFLRKHGFGDLPSGPAKGEALASVIDDLGFVQVDSVNTFARAHDMILWSRRQTYRPKGLSDLLSRHRAVFEHWTHDASVIPIASFPHWQHRFRRDRERLASRWEQWHQNGFDAKIDEVCQHIADNGPATSGEVGLDEGRSKGWWEWHPSKTALEYLWRVGEISVLRRDGFTKVYDLTERVIPQVHLGADYDPAQTIDWACRAALSRLGFASATEISAFFDLVTKAEAKDWCTAARARDEIREVEVLGHDGKPRRAFVFTGENLNADPLPQRLRILSPFDPALRDRARAERLFGFYYRIEIFVPAPKRQYGYYVFPVMEGDRLIGRIDMKTDRAADTLRVAAFWPEAGVIMGKQRLARLEAELERARRYADLSTVTYADGWCVAG